MLQSLKDCLKSALSINCLFSACKAITELTKTYE